MTPDKDPDNGRGQAPKDPATRSTCDTTRNFENISPRRRAGWRSIEMIAAAHDRERFGRLWADSERTGETERKWTAYHLAAAARYYCPPADLETLVWRAIIAHLDGDS